MIPELGHFALILALCLALAQALFPLVGAARGEPAWMAVARPAARGQLLFVALAFAALAYAFAAKDFSVAYVARNANSSLPGLYRISATWGAHEGSLLLWTLILGLWTAAVTALSRGLPPETSARVIGVLGLVSTGFLLFMLTTSNPFARLYPPPAEGADLNPLLQDPGLALHPPMLYMGYVGFAIPFAFAIAALLEGRLDAAWARWSRPWTALAWVFLTLGIALGSWWAYYELGWGGWWFWDPVENASFMPWLVGTALMHSLAVTESRATFKTWTVLLAILAFSLSLLGTFLVRSGVLTSVHAFATDPARGLFILIFLGLVVGGSLVLYARRAAAMRSSARFQPLSRETALLVNNVLLVVAAGTVLLGTLYPLVLDALGLGKISVGPPYFEAVFVPLMIPAVALMAIAPILRWKRTRASDLGRSLRYALAAAAGIFVLFLAGAPGKPSLLSGLGIAVAAWVALATAQAWYRRVTDRRGRRQGVRRGSRGFHGMCLAHLGVGVFIVGATLTGAYHVEKDVRLEPGGRLALGGYLFEFEGTRERTGPNYRAEQGTLRVRRGGEEVARLRPEKRHYPAQERPMTEAAIDPGLLRDLYVALGESLGDGAWTMRVHIKPFVRWIWLGALMMAAGGLLAASDRRYRPAPRQQDAAGRHSRGRPGRRETRHEHAGPVAAPPAQKGLPPTTQRLQEAEE